MTKKSTAMALVVIIAIVAAVVLLREGGNDSHQLRIAGNLPLTGPVAAFSGQYPLGFEMGLGDAVAAGTVTAHAIAVDFQDNQAKPANAVSILQQQRLTGFDVYISGTSEAAEAVVAQVDEIGALHFLVVFDPFLARESSTRVRLQPNSKIEGPLFVQYAKTRQAKRVYIIQLNSKYANEEVSKIIVPGLDAAGINSAIEKYEFPQRDFRTIVVKAQEFQPDLTFVIGYSIHLRPALGALREAGLVTPGSVMTVMDFVDFLYDGTPTAELEDFVFACPLLEVSGAVAGADEWRERFHTAYGKRPHWVAAYAYDVAQVLATTLNTSRRVDLSSLKAVLPYDGLTGIVQIDDDGDIMATITIAKVNTDGKVVALQ